MSQLSDTVLKTATVFLGPAANVLLERQTKGHMNGLAFVDIKPEHLPDFLYWLNVSASLIIKEKSQLLISKLESELNVKAANRPSH